VATILKYMDAKAPRNQYPRRIISPSQSGPCCFTHMEDLGPVRQDGRWEYRYRRCRTCGFTVRVILRALPDTTLIRDLRRTLKTAFQRKLPDP
jgi:hypothetical protein